MSRLSGTGRKTRRVYAQSATAAVFNLVHRDFAPLADRLRSVIARERQIPSLLAAGKANVEHPPLERLSKSRCAMSRAQSIS